MLSLFQKVAQQYNNKLPFVVYCKPNTQKMIGVFQHDDSLHELIHFNESGFAFVAFDSNKKYFIPAELSDVFVENASSDSYYVNQEMPTHSDAVATKKFEALVEKGISAIAKNQFKKVVLSRKETFEMSNLDVEKVMNSLHFNYPNAFNYCFFHPKIGLWIGATPEQFMQITNDTIKTVALAGTQLFAETISWESKEKDEQQLVTHFIFENLKMYCHDMQVSQPYTFKAGAMAHIKTDIAATLNAKSDLGKLIQVLHPTPAVCGLPKENAKKFILENEGYERKFYTGFLGELNIDFTTFRKENSDLFVNLRCMEVKDNKANIYVGCGITKDSNPQKEYIETVNKSMTIRKVVNL